MWIQYITGDGEGGRALFDLPKGKYSFQVVCSEWGGTEVDVKASLTGDTGEFGTVMRPPQATEALVLSSNEEPYDCNGGKFFEFSTTNYSDTPIKVIVKRHD